jgi:polyether ionophore transport system permease protein
MTASTVLSAGGAETTRREQSGGFVGTGALLRLALRRDRVVATTWILIFVLMAAGSAGAVEGLYPDHTSRVSAAAGINNTPAMVALYGRVYDPTSLGAVGLIKLVAFGAAFVALVCMFTVVRHTRSEEEAGRLELIGATVVGRYASLTAALLMSVGASLVLGVLTAFGLAGAGLPTSGAFAFGLSWAFVGIAFAAVGAVAAQVTSSARTARALGASVLAVAYLLRAVGDSTGEESETWLSWVSPIGWGQQVRPFAGDQWWVLLYLAVFAVLVSAGAYALVSHRDHGAGLLADRPGPANAAVGLRTPLALAFRLQRGGLTGWLVATALGSLVLGSMASQVGNMLESPEAREFIAKLGGQSVLTDAFLSAEMGILGVVVSAYGISAALRLRSEEGAGRAEPLLAAHVSRLRFAASHLTVALVGTTALMLTVGVFAGLAHGLASDDMSQFGRLVGAASTQLPAVWVLTGIAVAVFGLAPRLVMAGWGALVLFVLLGQLGPVLKAPEWLMDVSPFSHTPKLPGGTVEATPLVALTLIAVALIAVGLTAFRRRDIG